MAVDDLLERGRLDSLVNPWKKRVREGTPLGGK